MENEWDDDSQGAMVWLFGDESLAELIREEVLIYTHHRRRVNGRPNLGWLRSAFHTQIQQIARQDPVPIPTTHW